MSWTVQRGLRRYLGLLVSGGLVVFIGALGVFAGHAAGDRARTVHRADRAALQSTLAGLVEKFLLLSAAEVADALSEGGAWSAAPGDPVNVDRLERLVTGTRALDAGAVLVGPLGAPLASWSAGGVLPAPDDAGWRPLRATAAAGTGALPLSDVLTAGDGELLAMGLPVPLAGGGRGLVLGLWKADTGPLQSYVAELTYGRTGHGYVVDTTGRVLAGPDRAAIGGALPSPEVQAGITRGDAGVLDTSDSAGDLVTSYQRAGTTGWTALTVQDRDEFEGALITSSRLVQGAVVALLLIAGSGLVALHRKRESTLAAVALRDELTGLYNRRGWYALAEHELERARRSGGARVLLFVDLDGLKQVNDLLGHRHGDRAISDAASVLLHASRASDLVGRLGGDEFVLLLGEDGRADVARRRLLDALERHNAGSDAAFELRLSVGAEIWFPDHACSLDELVRRADAQMYADKSSRPGRADGLLRLPAPRSTDHALPVAPST